MFAVIVALCVGGKGPLSLMRQVQPNFVSYLSYVPVCMNNNCCFNFVLPFFL